MCVQLLANFELKSECTGECARNVNFPEDWQPTQFATLLYIVKGDEILLIEKLRGHGAGKVNAPGGRIELGETPEECAMREVFEEVGLTVLSADLKATLRFHDTHNGFNMLGYAFVATEFTGQPKQSDEAIPFWVSKKDIPYDRMWEDDRYWLPRILNGEQLDCWLIFKNDELQEFEIKLI